ncbi:MAG: 2-C-methyl-D-erythritol 4-phosphate cytidylyltransferase [Cytophagales bacterium]|nr:2-C-methyl-D-erythritol 4-phosphate cytidylyltransferase [Cytophagales bacterium]
MHPNSNQHLTARFFALIPCAGAGLRAGGDAPKQYQTIAGRPMVLHTLDAFAGVTRIGKTVVVVSPDDATFATFHAAAQVVYCGGATRADTVKNGLQALLDKGCSSTDWVLVHDAARCLITTEQINHLIDECQADAVGGLLACPVADTLKSGMGERIDATVDRADKWVAQTPQMFRVGALQAALDKALQAGIAVTDESSALESIGLQPKLVKASSQNFKVTYPEDFALAEAILQSRKTRMTSTPTFRIGEGWDTHQLVVGRPLVLGGVLIPFSKGLLGHSDADALCHAITDALLGAAALGDIGKHFPDTDPRYQGADSMALLQHTAALVREGGWQIGNVDSTVIAQAPKLAPHIEAMRNNLSAALGLETAQVNVKAKTAEKMGPVGEGLAMEARAVVMLLR